jgi:DNA-binding NtrC family response regulator
MQQTVLVVDDDKATRIGLAEVLHRAGYRVVAAGTFPDAREIMRTSPPDLLITDIRLEAFNGLQLLLTSPRPVPTIIMTGFADPVIEHEARRSGADFILKPVNPEALLQLVTEKLARSVE